MAVEDALDTLVSRLRKLDEIGVSIATEALPDVLAAARATASAGTSPDGKTWAPTKSGKPALANAAKAITAEVSGSTKAFVTLILKSPYVFHQRSKSKGPRGLPRREILPELEDALPAPIVRALAEATKRVVARTMGGRT